MNLFAAFFSMFAIGFCGGMGVSALIDKNYKLAVIHFLLVCMNIPFFVPNLLIVLNN